jgi:ATP-dependent helicase/nuclease subunit A
MLPALAALGWDPEGGDAEVELPPPAGAQDAATRLAVRVSAPGAERARALAERLPAPPPVPAPAAGEPPLARPERILPVGHLSYSALAEYERCGYRFYVERLLGLDEPPDRLHPDAAGAAGLGEGEGRVGARARRLALGNAVHAALEWSARHGWERPDEPLLAALLAEQGAGSDVDAADRARALVDGWLGSSLRAELDGATVRAEVPFAIRLAGTVVRGQIDLLAPGPEPLVLDYKTDALGDEGPAALAGRYGSQRELYALAAAAANGGEPARAVRAVHCFLEAPDAPEVEVFDGPRLAAARERLEGLIGEIRAVRGLEPTSSPSWTVCNGCPAAATLCPHPGWRPPRRKANVQG